jgi:hypothetical protein
MRALPCATPRGQVPIVASPGAQLLERRVPRRDEPGSDPPSLLRATIGT